MEKIFKLPDVGEGVAEAELVEWLVEVGDTIAEDQAIAVVTTDKANIEVPSPYAGKLTWKSGEPGDQIAIGAEFAKIDDMKGDATAAAAKPAKAAPAPAPKRAAPQAPTVPQTAPPSAAVSSGSSKVHTSPAVRARAKSLQIDLGNVGGTGAGGRITHYDLDQFLIAAIRAEASSGSGPAVPTPKPTPAPAAGPKPAPFVAASSHGKIQVNRLSSMRRAISKKMNQAKPGVPHFSYVEEVDVTDLEAMRREMNAKADGGEKLSILPFIMRTLVLSVPEAPYVNALYNGDRQEVHIYDEIRLGIAVATDKGLMVPVIGNAQNKDVYEAAAAIRHVADAARDGTASRDELVGSTMTLTSLGALGGIASTPVLNPPEVAIIGVNKVRTAPVWNGEAFEPRQLMNLSCSFDHRIIDGQAAAKFVAAMKRRIEACEI